LKIKEARLAMKISMMFALACCLALGCHKDNPVDDNNTCTMTGTWLVTYTSSPGWTETWYLNEDEGHYVRGTHQGFFHHDQGTFLFIEASIGREWFWGGVMRSDCKGFEGTYSVQDKGGGNSEIWSFKGVRK
jgi:hypothetical protein